MSQHLYIILGAEPASPVSWGLWDVESLGVVSFGRFDSARELSELKGIAHAKAIVILPGMDVIVRLRQIPARNDQQARKAARYTLEDDLASEVGVLHFAVARGRAQSPRVVAAIAQVRLEEWLAIFDQALLAIDEMVPDFCGLDGEDRSKLVDLGDRLVMSVAGGGGFAFERELAPHLLPELLLDESELDIYADDADMLLSNAGYTGEGAACHSTQSTDELIQLFAMARQNTNPINLLQGPFAPKQKNLPKLGEIKLAGMLAACVMVVLWGAVFAEGLQLKSATAKMEQRIESVYRETFPEEQRVINPVSQMRAKLALAGNDGDSSFLELSAILFKSLSQTASVSLRSLRYDAQSEELRVELRYQGFDDVQTIKAKSASNGVEFVEGAARQDEMGIVGSAVLRLK